MTPSQLDIHFKKTTLYHVCAQSLSRVQLFATPCTVAHQALLSIELSRQQYWSGLPFSTLRNLPNPGIKPTSLASLHWYWILYHCTTCETHFIPYTHKKSKFFIDLSVKWKNIKPFLPRRKN